MVIWCAIALLLHPNSGLWDNVAEVTYFVLLKAIFLYVGIEAPPGVDFPILRRQHVLDLALGVNQDIVQVNN